MSVLDWTIANPKLFLVTAGSILTVGIGGTVMISNLGIDSSHYLFRSVPDQEIDRLSTVRKTWSETMDGKHFHEAPLVSHSYERLIEGDINYNKGNYLIYYGSEACPHCTKFLFGDLTAANGSLNMNTHKMSSGRWMQAFEFTKTDPILKNIDIKFLMFEDIPNSEESDDFWDLPWSTWSDTDLTKGRIKDEYKRYDESALAFRKVISKSKKEFGSRVPGTPTVIVYKDGVPKVFNQDKLEGLNMDRTDSDESMSNDSTRLVRFIKYYFTNKNI